MSCGLPVEGWGWGWRGDGVGGGSGERAVLAKYTPCNTLGLYSPTILEIISCLISLLTAFSVFPKNAFFLKVVKSWDCIVKG